MRVVASTSILAALATEVGGEFVVVETLIKPGVDPHTFESTPGDIRTLSEADLVLLSGLGLDDFLLDDISGAAGDVEVAIVSEGIAVIENGDDDHDSDDHNRDGKDPHIWQDPLRVKQMVTNISDALSDADPEHSSQYEANADSYHLVLDRTHEEIVEMLGAIPTDQRKLVTNHDAFAYFAERYSLEIVGAVIPGTSTEADPSAGQIADLIELIEEESIAAIFAEDLIDPKVAESLAGDAGVEIVYGLYTGQVGPPGSGAESVHDMLLANATKISEALR